MSGTKMSQGKDSMMKNVQRKENNIVHNIQDHPTQIRTQ